MDSLRSYDSMNEYKADWLNLAFPHIVLISGKCYYSTDSERVMLKDAEVNRIVRETWLSGYEYGRKLVFGDLTSVKDVSGVFQDNAVIETFDEFKCFTGLNDVPDYCFSSCTALRSIRIPQKSMRIGKMAFNHCTSLTHVELPEGVENLDDNAFNSCTSLTSIVVPKSVSRIGNWLWVHCTSLKEVTFLRETPPDFSIGTMFSDCPSLESIYVPKQSVRAYQNHRRIAMFYKDLVKPIS